jgi:two-component system, sensor histidine kinase
MQLSGELARSLLEAAPDATVIVDSRGTIVFANAQITQTFGYVPEELVGAEVEVLLPQRFRDVHPAHREAFFAAPKPRPMGFGLSLHGLHKNGREFPVEISLSPVRTESGALLVVGAIRDATSQKDTEHQLVEANRAKSRFLAAASHDLRQPLQTLNLLNRVARREAAGNPRLEMVIDRQQQALDSMSGLLASVLDISKLDSGAVVPEPADCSVDEILERLASDFEPQAIEKGLSIAFERCGEAARTDPELLRRLLGNLVSNAIRYTHHGEIRLGCSAADGELELTVADTGIGIPDGEMNRIFDEFYQVDRGTQRPEGLGLGLSIVRRLAELLGHRVGVRSGPTGGTVFTVSVQRCAMPETTATAGAAVNAPAGGVILVIDDEPAVAEATGMLLELEGFEVRIASCEREALDHARERPPDLMVSDYHLRGGETGLGVVKAVRGTLRADVPAVFLTGDTAREAIDSARLARVRLLTKPLRGDELIETIHSELALRQPTLPAP